MTFFFLTEVHSSLSENSRHHLHLEHNRITESCQWSVEMHRIKPNCHICHVGQRFRIDLFNTDLVCIVRCSCNKLDDLHSALPPSFENSLFLSRSLSESGYIWNGLQRTVYKELFKKNCLKKKTNTRLGKKKAIFLNFIECFTTFLGLNSTWIDVVENKNVPISRMPSPQLKVFKT